MKTLELNNYGVQEMNAGEMNEVNGGIFPLLLIAAVAIIASSCNNNVSVNIGHGTGNSVAVGDSTKAGSN